MNTLKKLRRMLSPKARARRPRHNPPGFKQVVNGPNHDRRKKPRQPTIIRRSTVRNMQYLVTNGLCERFDVDNMRVPTQLYRKVDPFTKEVTTEKIDDKSPTYGV